MAGTSKAAQRLARLIEHDILAERSRPGDRLGGEAELIARYDTSRTLFREAMRLLEHDGICEMRRGPGGGLFVIEMDSDAVSHAAALWLHFNDAPVDDLYDIRELLEVRCARLAAERIDAAGELRLRACRDRERKAIADGDAAELNDAVNDFHVAIAEIAGNAVAFLFVQVLTELNAAYAGASEYTSAQLDAVDRAHEAIARAIIAGDADLTERRSATHMKAACVFSRHKLAGENAPTLGALVERIQ